jgi:hypothetical protein
MSVPGVLRRAGQVMTVCQPRASALLWVDAGLQYVHPFFHLRVFAQPGFFESEHNDMPADADHISAPVEVYGAMPPGDQDASLLTVTDNDGRKFWNFELTGYSWRVDHRRSAARRARGQRYRTK